MKEISRLPKLAKVDVKSAAEAEKVKDTKGEKIAEAVKDVAPIVAQVAIDLAGPKKKKDVKTWTAVGLSTLYIILDLLNHLSVL